MWSSSEDSSSSPESTGNKSPSNPKPKPIPTPSSRHAGSTLDSNSKCASFPIAKLNLKSISKSSPNPSESGSAPRFHSASFSKSGSAPKSNVSVRSEGAAKVEEETTPLAQEGRRRRKPRSKRKRYAFNFDRSSSSSSSSSCGSSLRSDTNPLALDCAEVDELLSSVKRRKLDEERGNAGVSTSISTSISGRQRRMRSRGERRAVAMEDGCASCLDERPHLDSPHFLSAKVSFAVDRGLEGEVPEAVKASDDVCELAKKMTAFRERRKGKRGSIPRLLTLAVQALATEEVGKWTVEMPQGLAEIVEHERRKVRRKVVVNACVNQYLTSYQREGVQFLFDAYQYGVGEWNGGVLADEMGLGKTVQVLAFVAAIQKKTGRPCDEIQLNAARRIGYPVVLIVCPASVLDNWHEETKRWGYFATEVAKTNEKMEQVLNQLDRRRLDVVIISYAKLRHFDQTTIAAKALKARTKFGLTGTPVQNNLDEFWCIVDVLCPGLFLSLHAFRSRFTTPIRTVLRREKAVLKAKLRSGKKDLIVLCPLSPLQEEAYLRFLDSKDIRFLKAWLGKEERDPSADPTMQHLTLWRLQHRSDELVGRSSSSSGLSATDTARSIVVAESSDDDEDGSSSNDTGEEEEQSPRRRGLRTFTTEVHESSDEEVDDGAGAKGEGGCRKRVFTECRGCPLCIFLPCMTILRKIANHLEMIRVDKSQPPGFERYKRLRTARLVLGRDGELFRSRTFQRLSNEVHCGKLLVLKTLLRKWKTSGHKVLFFSNSTVLLDIVESFILKLNLRSLRLDGETPQAERQALCKEFNTDKHVFIMLISTKAGGVGLNLTGAQKVVIFDPSWNPSDDLQAQDRAYRIGQTERVEVYRLISKGTIEEAALFAQIDKQQLASMVLDEKNFQKRLFNASEVKGMEKKLTYFMEGIAQKVQQKQKRSQPSGDAFVMATKTEEKVEAAQPGKKFDILDENMQIFETCGIEDTVDWNALVTHDEESKRAELEAIRSQPQTPTLDRDRDRQRVQHPDSTGAT